MLSALVGDDFGVVRTLVVEDDPEDFALFREALQEAQAAARFEFSRAGSLADALERLAAESFDIGVIDLNLPDSDGATTYARLREIAPGMPLVVVTGSSDFALAHQLLRAGAQDYVVKGERVPGVLARCLLYAIDRKRHEEELESARQMALEASAAKSRFLASMSHEIRTPMNSILGMADVLLESGLREDQVGYVEIFRRAGEGMVELLNGLLDFSKLESDQFVLDDADVALWDALESAVELMAFAAHRKGLSLSLDIDPGLPAGMRGDQVRLRQILLNLVGNAVKFTDRGRVTVRARPVVHEDGLRLCVEVEDTGPGIAPDKLDAVFQDFLQADVSTARRYGGSGLGLALARRLAERMGGRLSATSSLGVGSCFRLELPCREPRGPNAKPRALVGRALLAEPDPLERELARRWLESWGLEVRPVSDSGDARAALQAGRFDIVLLAARLPGQGGLDLLRQDANLRAVAPRTVLLMSANRRPGDLEACRELQLGGWIERPLKPSVLRRSIECVLLGEEGRAAEPKPAARPAPSLTPLRVLAADDSLDNRSLLQAYLRGTPVELALATNGKEAVERLRGERFDIVLMDAQMPVMNGYDAVAAVRKREREEALAPTPILMLSAFAFPEERQRSVDVGCNAHLVKPIRKAELIEQLYRHAKRERIVVEADPELGDLVPGYLMSRRQDLAALRAALAGGGFEEIRKLGHNMKGTGRSYGFAPITEIGARLERAGKSADAAESGAALDALAEYLTRVEVVSTPADAEPAPVAGA